MDKDVIIEKQAAQIRILEETIARLEEKIARLEKNSSNSSKPPSSDIINPPSTNVKKKKRKIGGQKGHQKHSRALFEPGQIDRMIIHKISAKEIRHRGLTPLNKTESALQQIDLPKQLFNVIDHRVQLYLDSRGNIVKAKLPKGIRKTGLFSAQMTALTGYLKARGHMSYSTLQLFFNDIMDLNVSQGYLAKICTQKLSPALQPAYAEVGQFIRNAPVVGTDETGHKNPAYKSAWTWCQHNASSCVLSYQQLKSISSSY